MAKIKQKARVEATHSADNRNLRGLAELSGALFCSFITATLDCARQFVNYLVKGVESYTMVRFNVRQRGSIHKAVITVQ